ncbi:MAG: hypothetical protein HY036_02500 [Nitrospirae bacterium]|nr:hypothetical protein [Nitrospirota bacterium]
MFLIKPKESEMINLSNLQIPPPANWQNFESLCCDLWAEIWKDPNTKKNGRLGQIQNGVDVCGRPNQGVKWAGVQCKGKDIFSNKMLTKKELLSEVEKAKQFVPALSEFIIATTGPKDKNIEELARKLTEENLSNSLFSIHVWSWSDIVLRLEDFQHLIEKYYPASSLNTKALRSGIDDIKESTKAILENYSEIKSSISSLSQDKQSIQKFNSTGFFEEIDIIDNTLDDRRNNALVGAKLIHRPIFNLLAYPVQKIDIPSLFVSRSHPVVELFENPPNLRGNTGFNLDTGDISSIISGQFRRCMKSEDVIIDLWRDGALIYCCDAVKNIIPPKFSRNGVYRINPLTLIENTYLFIDFAQKIYEHATPKPHQIRFRLELINNNHSTNKFSLVPGGLNGNDWQWGGSIKEASQYKIICSTIGEKEPGEIAFDLIGELYPYFGMEQDKIPYKKFINGRYDIDSDQIINHPPV